MWIITAALAVLTAALLGVEAVAAEARRQRQHVDQFNTEHPRRHLRLVRDELTADEWWRGDAS